MVKYQVIYFSRSGTCKRIAEEIGEQLSVEPIRVSDHKNWNGIFGFIKAGYYSSANKDVEITVDGKIHKEGKFIVVAPLWAGKLAPAVRALFKKVNRAKTHLVISSKGSTMKEKKGYGSVHEIVEKNKDEAQVLQGLYTLLSK